MKPWNQLSHFSCLSGGSCVEKVGMLSTAVIVESQPLSLLHPPTSCLPSPPSTLPDNPPQNPTSPDSCPTTGTSPVAPRRRPHRRAARLRSTPGPVRCPAHRTNVAEHRPHEYHCTCSELCQSDCSPAAAPAANSVRVCGNDLPDDVARLPSLPARRPRQYRAPYFNMFTRLRRRLCKQRPSAVAAES